MVAPSIPSMVTAPHLASIRAASITAAERQQGSAVTADITVAHGGAYRGPQTQYAHGAGRRIAVQSGLSSDQSAFNAKLLNSSVDNAFAIPKNEVELAAVLDNEVGHVAALHSAKRQDTLTHISFGGLGEPLVGSVTDHSGVGQLLTRGISTSASALQGSRCCILTAR